MSSSTGQYSNIPPATHHITTNDVDGTAKFHVSELNQYKRINPYFAMSIIYSTSTSPPSLSNNDDIATHERLLASDSLGSVPPNGTVCNVVEIGPGVEKRYLHRTQTLDYGVVLAGEVELSLDSGETRILKAGDVVVQRATMHAWRNPSKTEWTRVFFVGIGCDEVVVGGRLMGPDMSAMAEITDLK